MNALLVLIMIMVLTTALGSAWAEGLALSDMTTAELMALQERIAVELAAHHGVEPDAEARIRALLLPVVSEAGRTIQEPWNECGLTCEWGLSVLEATVSICEGPVSQTVALKAGALLRAEGDQLIYLVVDEVAYVDHRDQLTDPRLIEWLGSVESESDRTAEADITYVCNTGTRKFHRLGCASISTIKESNKQTTSSDRDELIRAGYAPCGRCKP